jgi:hypothetical protein
MTRLSANVNKLTSITPVHSSLRGGGLDALRVVRDLDVVPINLAVVSAPPN